MCKCVGDRSMISILQATWIQPDTDEEESSIDEVVDHMVTDETESGYPGEEGNNHSYLSDDQASLDLRDSDGETDADSVMMVSFNIYIYIYISSK